MHAVSPDITLLRRNKPKGDVTRRDIIAYTIQNAVLEAADRDTDMYELHAGEDGSLWCIVWIISN